MGGDSSKEQKSEGVINNNLILDNELKTTNNDMENMLKILVVISILVLLYLVIKSIVKAAKNNLRMENLLLQRITSAQPNGAN